MEFSTQILKTTQVAFRKSSLESLSFLSSYMYKIKIPIKKSFIIRS